MLRRETAASASDLASAIQIFPPITRQSHCKARPQELVCGVKMFLASLAVAVIAASCAPVTPQTRIQRAPDVYEALPADQQALVQRGELARGMSRDAVWLAWGAPAQRFEGARDARSTERWDYTGTQPVYHTTFAGGYGRYGPYGPYGRYGAYSAFAFGPEIAYIPYRRASVWFLDGRVEAWERVR